MLSGMYKPMLLKTVYVLKIVLLEIQFFTFCCKYYDTVANINPVSCMYWMILSLHPWLFPTVRGMDLVYCFPSEEHQTHSFAFMTSEFWLRKVFLLLLMGKLTLISWHFNRVSSFSWERRDFRVHRWVVKCNGSHGFYLNTFTFMNSADDAFIQSNLHRIILNICFWVCATPGIEPKGLARLAQSQL